MRMSRGLLLVASVALSCSGAAFASAAGSVSSAAIGNLTFTYQPESWRIVPDGDGLIATCVQADCDGAVVDISRRVPAVLV
jgi:hypothetical protein